MWWVKIAGSLCILIGCTAIGADQTFALKNRIMILREMERSLLVFQNLTQTYRLPLEMVCSKISAQGSGTVSEFFKRLGDTLHDTENMYGEAIWKKMLVLL